MVWTKCRNFIGFVTLSFLFSLFVSVSSCHAVDDYSFVLDASHAVFVGVCNNSNPSSSISGHACTDYKYLYFTTEDDFSSIASSIYFMFDDHNMFQVNSLKDPVVFNVPSNVNISIFGYNVGNLPSGWKITATFSNTFPGASCPPAPSGTLSISENGSYDVTDYAEVDVSVIAEVIQGDYHDDLVAITNGIYVCAGTLLVLYFFYTIYRLIIRNSGVK